MIIIIHQIKQTYIRNQFYFSDHFLFNNNLKKCPLPATLMSLVSSSFSFQNKMSKLSSNQFMKYPSWLLKSKSHTSLRLLPKVKISYFCTQKMSDKIRIYLPDLYNLKTRAIQCIWFRSKVPSKLSTKLRKIRLKGWLHLVLFYLSRKNDHKWIKAASTYQVS